jgi:poly(3-hydroxybutyrate) depolymerase
MRGKTIHLFAALILIAPCAPDRAGAQEVKQELSGFMSDLVLQSEFEVSGRKVRRYSHAEVDGMQVPFYLVPADGTIANPPLHVVLHHAGGSAPQAIREAFSAKHRHQFVAKEHCALYLDCKSRGSDWWWGWKTIEKDRERYGKELQAAEARVLESIEWAIQDQKIDRDRVYLSGRSMGGSGSLGIGYVRGDIFAAILVNVPAGAGHALFRLNHSDYPDPPPVINTSSQTDGWSRGQEDLLAYCHKNKLPMIFGWGPFGHASRPSTVNSAVYDFPWRDIVRNAAYPVFTNADSDKVYPGFQGKGDHQNGQINGYFRWKNLTDSADELTMELRLVRQDELGKPAGVPEKATTDVTLRRLQSFKPGKGKPCSWELVRAGEKVQGGEQKPDEGGLLTLPKIVITGEPAMLRVWVK